MQRRLKLSYWWPGNWKIRSRLMTAGLSLSILACAAPLYMRLHLAQLAGNYTATSASWEALDHIHEMSALVTDAQSKLRAFAASGDRVWLDRLPLLRISMDQVLAQIWTSSNENPRRAMKLWKFEGMYRQWIRTVFEPTLKGKLATEIDKSQLMADPNERELHIVLSELASDIRNETTVASKQVHRGSRKAVAVVTYGGIGFVIGFATLMLSLWFTLIPGLGLLVAAAKELKRGNLDHRVYIAGRSETAQLGRAFNEMAVSLKAQNEKLKELNRLKTDFVSTVSHELRTPLTAIKGSIGLILGGVTGEMPLEAQEMLKITQKNTDRLIRLINEVLDVAKIEAGAIQMRFDKHSLADTISHAILGIEGYARTRGIKVEWNRPQTSPLVVIDRDRIEQVITNLLSNAIKFTESGSKVVVHSFWESDRVVIEVADTGEGIPEEFLDRIFQKFQQAESAAHKAKEGTGLGLTIAKAIVEEHGGAIWVKSKLGSGSTFSFSIPWNGTEFVDARKAQAMAAARSRRKTILVIDNEEDFTTVLAKLLEHEGYQPLTARDGRTGIELARKHQPDLIILDVMMPEIDGFAVRKLLLETQDTKEIPVVFATISPDLGSSANTTVLTKPLVEEDFKQWLREFFADTQSRRRAA